MVCICSVVLGSGKVDRLVWRFGAKDERLYDFGGSCRSGWPEY